MELKLPTNQTNLLPTKFLRFSQFMAISRTTDRNLNSLKTAKKKAIMPISSYHIVDSPCMRNLWSKVTSISLKKMAKLEFYKQKTMK